MTAHDRAPSAAPIPTGEAQLTGGRLPSGSAWFGRGRVGKHGDMSTEHEDDQEISREEADRERRRRRTIFLRELAEARELRKRVAPRRSRRARIHETLRMRTFRL